MEKKITQEQTTGIMKVLENLNIPVKEYIAIQNLFQQLPVIEKDTKQISGKVVSKDGLK